MEAVNRIGRANVLQVPEIELLNGQHAEVSIPLGTEDGSERRYSLLLECVIAQDRRAVRLTLGVNVRHIAEASPEGTRVVPDGQALLVEITDRLGPPEPSTAAPWVGKIPYLGRYFTDSSTADSAKRVFVLVRPTIVVKEEEEKRLRLL